MTADAIPDGPIDREPTAFLPAVEREAILRSLLGGVELGVYDEHLVHWLVGYADSPTFTVIASWIKRTGAAS